MIIDFSSSSGNAKNLSAPASFQQWLLDKFSHFFFFLDMIGKKILQK